MTGATALYSLEDGRVLILSSPCALDGRLSSYPRETVGYAPMQCYLLSEDASDAALLVGTGLSVHQQSILDCLASVVDPGTRLSLIPSGFDFTRLCNARPIADRFGLEYVYQPPIFGAPLSWLNFRPEFPFGAGDALQYAEPRRVSAEPFAFDDAGARMLQAVTPPLRLLPNQWLYDANTATLFTVDLFGWVVQPEPNGPWVVTETTPDPTTVRDVSTYLFRNRYWWLPGIDTSEIRSALRKLFEEREVRNIAPEQGCVLSGADVVRRHCQLLDEALASTVDLPEQNVEVGRWRFDTRTVA